MEKRRRRYPGAGWFILLLAGLAGCTGDPNQGGIFWSPAKADERLAERRAALMQARQDTAHEEATGDRLRTQRAELDTRLAGQRAELSRIDADLARLRADARGDSANAADLRARLQQVENRRAALRLEDHPADLADKEQELAALRAQVAQLKEHDELLRQTR